MAHLQLVSDDGFFHVIGRPPANERSIAGRARPRVVHPDHGLLVEASQFLIELQKWRNSRGGSLEDIAYIIADWCNYVHSQGATWRTASDRHYIRWLKPGGRNGVTGSRRLGRKAAVIWRWYQFLKRIVDDPLIAKFAEAITERGEDGAEGPRYHAGGSPRLKDGKRPIPSDREVEVVLAALAARGGFEGERNWLLGEVIYKTGLRAMGLHAFNLSILNSMLAPAGVIDRRVKVETLARDKVAKARVRQRLQALQASGRTQLITSITEKRGKTRDVGFPINLVQAVLEFVWGPRASLLKKPGFNEPKATRAIWVGSSGGPLALGSIKNVLGQGFRDAKVKGSGHSLRAAFLTNEAVRLIRRAKAIHGREFDDKAVLLELIEIAGHEDDSSLPHYLSEARVREAFFDAADEAASTTNLRTEG